MNIVTHYPNMSIVKKSIKLLYQKLSPQMLEQFNKSIDGNEVKVPVEVDIHSGSFEFRVG